MGEWWDDSTDSPPATPIPEAYAAVADTGSSPSATAHRTFAITTVVVFALALAAMAGVGWALRGPSVPGAGMVPAAFVASATRTTLSQRTADIVVTGSVSTTGLTVPLHGTGQTDLTAGTLALRVTASGTGHALLEREHVVDGHSYVDIAENGADVSSLLAGKHWVDMPLAVGAKTGTFGTGPVDPVSQLALLGQKGNAVRPLGASTINGTTASGYAVTPNRQTVERRARAAIASEKLSPAAQALLDQSLKTFAGLTMDVWFDASGLMQRMAMTLDTTTGTAHLIMTFVNYGTPVRISAPPSGQVVSYSTFLAAVQSHQSRLSRSVPAQGHQPTDNAQTSALRITRSTTGSLTSL
jgi:hypothetical protein